VVIFFCDTVQYSTVQYSTVQYSTVRYGTVRYSTDKMGNYENEWSDVSRKLFCVPTDNLGVVLAVCDIDRLWPQCSKCPLEVATERGMRCSGGHCFDPMAFLMPCNGNLWDVFI